MGNQQYDMMHLVLFNIVPHTWKLTAGSMLECKEKEGA